MTREELAAWRAGAEAMRAAAWQAANNAAERMLDKGQRERGHGADLVADAILALPLPEPPDA